MKGETLSYFKCCSQHTTNLRLYSAAADVGRHELGRQDGTQQVSQWHSNTSMRNDRTRGNAAMPSWKPRYGSCALSLSSRSQTALPLAASSIMAATLSIPEISNRTTARCNWAPGARQCRGRPCRGRPSRSCGTPGPGCRMSPCSPHCPVRQAPALAPGDCGCRNTKVRISIEVNSRSASFMLTMFDGVTSAPPSPVLRGRDCHITTSFAVAWSGGNSLSGQLQESQAATVQAEGLRHKRLCCRSMFCGVPEG